MAIWQKPMDLKYLTENFTGGLGRTLAIEITEFGDDFLAGTMPVSEKATQPFGMLNGGASCVLAETLGSVASNMCLSDPDSIAVGLQLSANHLRPVPQGETIYGKAVAKHLGRTTHLWNVSITDQRGKAVCEVMFSTAIVKKR